MRLPSGIWIGLMTSFKNSVSHTNSHHILYSAASQFSNLCSPLLLPIGVVYFRFESQQTAASSFLSGASITLLSRFLHFQSPHFPFLLSVIPPLVCIYHLSSLLLSSFPLLLKTDGINSSGRYTVSHGSYRFFFLSIFRHTASCVSV